MKLIFEQMGRISITGVTIIGIISLNMSKLGEVLSMITLIIWMILPSIELIIKTRKEIKNEKNNRIKRYSPR